MHQSNVAKLDRFNKKSKELLVDFINAKNNRGLTSDQLVFGKPKLMSGDGLSEVDVSFDESTGWPHDQKRPLGYYRINLEVLIGNQPLTVHVLEDGDDALLKAIHEQYGLLLEKELVTIQLVTRNLPDSTPQDQLSGFEGEDAEEEPTEPEVPPYLDNRNYRLTFKDDHLIFFGGLTVQTRRSIQGLGGTIDSLLDLREYYSDGKFDLPKVDLVFPRGELYVDETAYPDYEDRKATNAYLYELKADSFILDQDVLHLILQRLTGDAWVSKDEKGLDFNLFGSKVLYNGFVKVDYGLERGSYNYVLAVELGAKCANLTGVVKIGYQFSSSKVPGNIYQNQASVLPLFPR